MCMAGAAMWTFIASTIPSAQRPCTPPEAATPPAEEEKVQRNANYAASSSTATTTTTTCLLMGERERGRRWEKQCNGYARQQQVCVSHGILCPLPLSPSSPVILRLPPAHDPLLLLPLDLRRAWSMPRSASRSRDRVPSAWAPHVAHARRRRTSR
ncbi:hypothetical protein B0H13DRAFT_916485 [Mycena leptocephala]|nr:hypothetical protein B0H13DRAFT_916485 [Mycena leptocephala]